MEQAQVVVVEVAHDHVQQGPAGQGEEHPQLQHGETAARLLAGGLRVFLLVGRRVGQLHRTAIDHLDRAPLQTRAGRRPLPGRLGGGGQNPFQSVLRQTLAGLDVSRGAFIHGSPALPAGQGLHLTDHFPASRVRLEHLPEKTLAGEAQGEEPLPAVGTFVRAGKQGNGNESGEVRGQLLEGALPEGGGGTAAQGGEAGAEGGKEGRSH